MKVKDLPVYFVEAIIDKSSPRQFLADYADGTALWTVDPLEAMPLTLDEAERVDNALPPQQPSEIKWLGDLFYHHKYPFNDRNGLRPKPDLNPVRNDWKLSKHANKFLKRYGKSKAMSRNALLDELLHSHEDEADYEEDMFKPSDALRDEVKDAYLGYSMSFKKSTCRSQGVEVASFLGWIRITK